jgi:hypothetical protein
MPEITTEWERFKTLIVIEFDELLIGRPRVRMRPFAIIPPPRPLRGG